MAPRGMGALIMMPIVGAITGRVDPRKLVGCGLLIGAPTLFWLGSLNLQAGYWDIFWPQLIQGFGMSLLFVPLTILLAVAVAYPCALFGLWFPDLRVFGLSAVRTLFFVAPSLVALDTVPEPAATWLKLNPLSGLFEGYRAALLTASDQLAMLSTDLNAFVRLLSASKRAEAEPYRDRIRSADAEVKRQLDRMSKFLDAL